MVQSYILDTSSIMAIPYHYPEHNAKEKVWKGIIQLIEVDRLKTIQIVLNELKRNADRSDGAHLRLGRVPKGKLLIDWRPFLPRAGQIADAFPRLSPYLNPTIKADTLIIAIAEKYGYIVVCNESESKKNMPLACDYFHVGCKILGDFVRTEKLDR